MHRDKYSSALFTYIRIFSFILKFPYDIKRYIYDFLENRYIVNMIFYTRITLLKIKPHLYISDLNNIKYLTNINREFIALNFKGIPFIIKGYNIVSKSIINENKLLESNKVSKSIVNKNNICYEKIYNYDTETFHLDNEKYNINLKQNKQNKLSKKKFLMKKNKENNKNFLDKKKKDRLASLEKKYSLIYKETKYFKSVYIDEDDEYEYQDYLIACDRYNYEYDSDYDYDYGYGYDDDDAFDRFFDSLDRYM
jgi:hypothetical protein